MVHPEGTDIVWFFKECLCFRSIYLASTIPAGQSWPPHPSFRSSCSFKGVARRWSKSISDVPEGFIVGSWTKSSSKFKKVLCSSSGFGCSSFFIVLMRRMVIDDKLWIRGWCHPTFDSREISRGFWTHDQLQRVYEPKHIASDVFYATS